MDVLNTIPELWKLIGKSKLSMNVHMIGNELEVNVINKRKIKSFRNKDFDVILSDIRSTFSLN